MNKIYMASKASHRPLWRGFRDGGYPINSRWIDVDDKYIGRDLPPDYDFSRLWIECIEDVLNADALILYCAPGDVLKGALFEMGAAVAAAKMVCVVGDKRTIRENGSWLGHPLVLDFTDWSIHDTIHWAATFGITHHVKES